ncbi:MAG: hemerythrin family protein [Desulfobulbaceae bacterium]|nr:hemerythrin family protein [Desulfobulbaceae bacterium]
MQCLEWRREFLVGVQDVDAQHQQLFAMLSALYTAIERHADEDDLLQTIDGLLVYLKEHFSREEALLRSHPRWDEHHRQHWRFTEKVLVFLREFKRRKGRGEHNSLALEIYDFLCGWLRAHIVEVDRRYFAELRPSH